MGKIMHGQQLTTPPITTITCFIGNEIEAHFGQPKLFIGDGVPKLAGHFMKVYSTKNALQ
ncbi:hypothetical protein DSO57_1010981 [Entomophthora muscae]|uniref:Uncharacterized protein n=1 Tax=Entomophthora muscae TaxID=34485 RepID=A0ACC2US49_9FUNG|nr:hypothetical protein DSO57_1010981 [Entomophthora muscae]